MRITIKAGILTLCMALTLTSCAQKAPEARPAFAEQSETTQTFAVTTAEYIELRIPASETELPHETVTSGTETASEENTESSSSALTETESSAQETSASAAEQTSAGSTAYPDVNVPEVSLSQTPPAQTDRIPDKVSDKVLFNYDGFEPKESYKEFYSKCVFVGDSICRGFKAYDILPARQVCAQGNTAARNILEFEFRVNGEDADLITCLKKLDPEYIVFSMGMNDVNMTSKQDFCKNYGYLLSLVENALPDAQLVVCSVTPILSDSKFSRNSKIDEYNAALKEYLDSTGKWIFADIAHGMKDKANGLKARYNGGDGIHLAPLAYHAILYQIAERVVDRIEYDSKGNVIHLDAPTPEETAETEDEEVPDPQ